MMGVTRVRIFRGDVVHVPAHVYIASSSGGLSGRDSVAARLAERHHLTDSIPKGSIPLGDARSFGTGTLDAPQVILAYTGDSGTDASPTDLGKALRAAFALAVHRDGDQPTRVAMPVIGARRVGVVPEAFIEAVREAAFDIPGDVELHIGVGDEHRQLALLKAFPPAEVPETIHEMIDALVADPGFLFVGSGLSLNAHPRLPRWEELFPTHRLPPAPTSTDEAVQRAHRQWLGNFLPDVAQVWADECTPKQVHGQMQDAIAVQPARPSVLHAQLVALPWKTILTTNYDTLIEQALTDQGRPFVVIRNDAELVHSRGTDKLRVVKLHGGLALDKSQSEIVATRDEYDGFFKSRPGLAAFLEAHVLTGNGLIVGHSMSDAHFRALFARLGNLSWESGQAHAGVLALQVGTMDDFHQRYWKKRGLHWHTTDVPGLHDVIDAITAAVMSSKAKLPPGFPDDATWANILAPLKPNGVERTNVIAMLLGAGGQRPGDAILEDVDMRTLVERVPEQFSPEERKQWGSPKTSK